MALRLKPVKEARAPVRARCQIVYICPHLPRPTKPTNYPGAVERRFDARVPGRGSGAGSARTAAAAAA